ncbi:hypothetical protein O181_035702 [Austropuccinia psidii MF-1]|uniref:Acyl-CoA desaturase n=1 Tax=Austropuccinia psidii MF-1 TaxID=1389203 RepID=A0A9Q3H982_9BASI|nr:hypothetical protein [Austropuccinia psidii MF-1]
MLTKTSQNLKSFHQNQGAHKPPIWWSNAIFFTLIHILGFYGAIFISPIHRVSFKTLILSLSSWQLATFSITIGYHRLWSHKSFKANAIFRSFLAISACLGFQGSIKWWVLRHRLHHRWTDSEFDPYNAKNGLLFSHMGWIFRKPKYEKLHLIDQSDLNRDPIVRFQHRAYLPLSLFVGFVLPDLISHYLLKSNIHSRWDGLIWAGIVARLLIWHFTFFINSLAHYVGHQLFDIDITARSNFFLALFTGGEANHNYHHVFPKDYRNGPSWSDWDPTKWIIYLLYRFTPLITEIYVAEPKEIERARQRVLILTSKESSNPGNSKFEKFDQINMISSDESNHQQNSTFQQKLPEWKKEQVLKEAKNKNLQQEPWMILLIDGYLVDVTTYAYQGKHPGGFKILQEFSLKLNLNNNINDTIDIKNSIGSIEWRDCGAQFKFEINQHTKPARMKMKELRIAKLID